MEKDIIYREFIVAERRDGAFDITELNGDPVRGLMESQASAKRYIDILIASD